MPNQSRLLITLIFLALVAYSQAHVHAANEVIIGKVVAVADGDTIIVSARYWHHSVIDNVKGNSYRLNAKEVQDAVNDCKN